MEFGGSWIAHGATVPCFPGFPGFPGFPASRRRRRWQCFQRVGWSVDPLPLCSADSQLGRRFNQDRPPRDVGASPRYNSTPNTSGWLFIAIPFAFAIICREMISTTMSVGVVDDNGYYLLLECEVEIRNICSLGSPVATIRVGMLV